jgi:hypothetical protein
MHHCQVKIRRSNRGNQPDVLEKTRETGLLTTMVFFQNVLSLRFLLGGDVEKFNEDKD